MHNAVTAVMKTGNRPGMDSKSRAKSETLKNLKYFCPVAGLEVLLNGTRQDIVRLGPRP
jgi:hypothetical protein